MRRKLQEVRRQYGLVAVLVASSNSGRFALDEGDGPDLSCGVGVSLLLGGQWIDGCVEYENRLYPVGQTFEQVMRGAPLQYRGGYCFVSSDGNICGLCIGMQVRLIQDRR